MRLGALLGPITDPEQGDFLAQQARRLAAEGYTSLWSAQAIGRGFMLSDPFIALGVAATAAPGVELGTAIVQATLYHPMDLAHRVFSLQQISGGRFLFGIGAGSTQADLAAFERPYESRFADFRESTAALRGIFASGGRDGASLSPWPPVQGGPPLFLGTWGRGVERAAREFDGWIASGAYRSVDEIAAAASRYQAAGGGRSVVSTIQLGPDTDLGELGERFAAYAEAGFDDAVVMLLPGGPSAAAVRALLP